MAVRTTAVDAVGLEERAASLAKRSIKRDAKLWALDLAIRSMDLTTLEGSDTVGKIVAICAKAVRRVRSTRRSSRGGRVPVPTARPGRPRASPRHDGEGRERCGWLPERTRSTGRAPAEMHDVAETGAHEIDIVLNRSLFLGGSYAQAFEELVAAREAAGAAHLKVISRPAGSGPTTACGKRACWRWPRRRLHQDLHRQDRRERHAAGGPLHDGGGADFHRDTGRAVGIKVAGGVRTAKQAIQNLVLLHETLGSTWMTPDRFRIGASSLLNDVLMQIEKERTGRYAGPDYFTID